MLVFVFVNFQNFIAFAFFRVLLCDPFKIVFEEDVEVNVYVQSGMFNCKL